MKKWFKKQIPGGGEYFTPFPEPKVNYFFNGNGEQSPSPKQIVESLSRKPDASYLEGGFFAFVDSSSSNEKAVDLPTGSYRYGASWKRGEFLQEQKLRDDTYIGISSLYTPIAEEIRGFVNNKIAYKNESLNVLSRLGMLLCGPPGNGKTSLIRELAYRELPSDAAVIFLNDVPSPEFTQALDEGLGNRVKLVVFEELANMLEQVPTRVILDFMDGETSMDNTITIATTNYPQYLPKNLLERTSRFDLLYYLDNPNAEERKIFLEKFGKLNPSEEDIKATDGMSIADLKEIVLSAGRRNETFTQAIKRLWGRKAKVKEILRRENEIAKQSAL